MRRALPAVLAWLAVLLAGCGGDEASELEAANPAQPQRATLGWSESYGEPGARIVFRVDSFAVIDEGWRAAIAVENDSSARYAVGTGSSLDRAFGLMLFPNGDLRELERLNRAGELPPIRAARTFVPPLPEVLEPGGRWQGTISARGSLPAGAWVRLVFGAFEAIGEPPEGLEEQVVWITDHAHRLRPGSTGGTV